MVGLGNIDDIYRHYLIVIEENQHLKELLVTCKYCVSTLMSKGVSDCNGVKLSGLLTKIDEVLK